MHIAGFVEARPLTEPKPFAISEDPVGAKARRQQRIRQEEAEAEKQRKFKARPVPVSHDNPFHTEKTSHALCEVKNVELASDKRAAKRAAFEKAAAARRAEAAKAKAEAEALKQAEINAAIDAEMEANRFIASKAPSFIKKGAASQSVLASSKNRRSSRLCA